MEKYTQVEPNSRFAYTVARAGLPFIGAAVFATAVFALLGIKSLALLSLAASLFICYFFRDPDRAVPSREGAVVSPADGKVIRIEKNQDNRFMNGPCLKISVFMSIFNVHINRIPYTGSVKKISYFPGKFFSANLEKASRLNEHNAILLNTEEGKDICFVQIAGLIARRILCYIQEGDAVTRGERFGLICFGSRLDVYLPPDTQIDVSVGDRVRAGTSILGKIT